MKSLLALSALLLLASPASARNFIYLSCETKTQLRTIDAETAQVIRDFEEIESPNENNIQKEIYKIDLKNSQYTHHLEGNRKSDVQGKIGAKIKNGKLMHFSEGGRGYLETKIQHEPPGEILINGSYVGFAMEGMYIGEFITKGSCEDINASDYENPLSQ